MHLAFTKAFIEKMRKKAIEMGDQLMRVLLTSEKNGHSGDYSILKVEVNSFMPESSTDRECHLPVMETGMPKYGDAFGNWPDQTLTEDEPGWRPGRRLQEDSNGLSCANSSNSSHLPLMQTVKSDQPAAVVGSYSTSIPNPAYPPMMQAVKDDKMTSDPGAQVQDQSVSKSGSSNPSYPPHLPLMQTVKSDQPAAVVGSYSTSIPNPAYPPMMQAVKDDKMTLVPGAQVQEQSVSKSGSSNPSYPPLMQAVNGNPSASSVTKHHTTCGDRSYSNPAYPPVSDAVQNSPTAFGGPGNQTREHLSTDNKENPRYPPTIQAVKPNTIFSGSDYQLENHPRTSGESKPAYPDLLHAVRNDTIRNETASSESCRSAEHSFTGDTISPAYPPIRKAVNDEPLPTTSGYNSPNGPGSNPPYPALMTAVQDNIPSSHTASQSEECCAIGNSGNQPYPPLIQAVQSFPLTPSADQQPRGSLSSLSVNNLEYSPDTQTSGSIPMSSTRSDSDSSMLVDDSELF